MLKAASTLVGLVGLLLLLYAAMKLARAQDGMGTTIDVGGRTATIEAPARQAAQRALTTSLVLIGVSAVGIGLSARRRRSR